ncbi:hypothetical protein ACR75P_08280 [Faecalicoccus pleomorphus]|uniref:hypothetical protein n=1 Tax=Faecalicoccus pleomorphus TaxID=1323 RepID=UPI003DA2D366
MLDEVFKKASFTSVLNSDSATIRQGANANEFLVAKLSMDGLKDYERNSGYTRGDVKMEWETLKFNYDRGILFQVDSMDDEETVGLSFGRLGAEFQRTQVAPEADAFTLATLAQEEGISTKEEETAFATGEAVLDVLREAQNKMDEDEVPSEQRILFITPTLYRLASSVVTYINKDVLDEFALIQKVPASRMWTKIDLVDDEANGTMKGGFKKAADAVAINFMIVHKPAVIKCDKHVASNIITPEANQSADAYMQKYRKYGTVDVYENKRAGIYLDKAKAA